MVTFFIGPFQFIPLIRENNLNLHRLLGKVYVLCVFVSAFTGFLISFRTHLVFAMSGTLLQSLAWAAVTLMALKRVKAKRIRSHQQWMLRSYALVLAAPVVRIGIYLLENLFGIDYQQNFDFYYPLLVWASWLPLILAEMVIQINNRGQTPIIKDIDRV